MRYERLMYTYWYVYSWQSCCVYIAIAHSGPTVVHCLYFAAHYDITQTVT